MSSADGPVLGITSSSTSAMILRELLVAGWFYNMLLVWRSACTQDCEVQQAGRQ